MKLEGPSEINYPALKTLHINTNFLIFLPKSCYFPVYPPSAITTSHLAAQARKPRNITHSYSFSLPPCPRLHFNHSYTQVIPSHPSGFHRRLSAKSPPAPGNDNSPCCELACAGSPLCLHRPVLSNPLGPPNNL